MAVRTKERVWATVDGELVREGDVRARFLKYGVGDVLDDEQAAEVAALKVVEEVDDKQAAAAQVKPVSKRAAKRAR